MKAKALYEFASRVQPNDGIEYIPCDDGSAIVTAVRDGVRVLSLTVDSRHNDGRVYDLAHVKDYLRGRQGYIVYTSIAT